MNQQLLQLPLAAAILLGLVGAAAVAVAQRKIARATTPTERTSTEVRSAHSLRWIGMVFVAAAATSLLVLVFRAD